MDSDANAIKPTKLGEMAANVVQESIISGQFNPGDSLPGEAELMARFRISRPTLREAMRILEARGLVRVYRGKKGGASVLHPTENVTAANAATYLRVKRATLQELQRARAFIEPELIRSLTGQLSAEDIAELRQHLEAAKDSIDSPAAYAQAITRFHTALFRLANNRVLTLMVTMLNIIYEPMVTTFIAEYPAEVRRPALRFEVNRQSQLLDLLESGEFDKAADFCRTNLARIGKIIDDRGAGTDLIGSIAP